MGKKPAQDGFKQRLNPSPFTYKAARATSLPMAHKGTELE
ncbi:hypothetical protein C4K40_3285 [Pseudomonas sp. CMR5c]|nr:hypothetical protein C4K40_3285 [Pseudomonas sp. CMR5c]